jgi:hypothetical protein
MEPEASGAWRGGFANGCERGAADVQPLQFEIEAVGQRDAVQAESMRVARAVDRLPGRRRDREHVPDHLRRREQRLGQLK